MATDLTKAQEITNAKTASGETCFKIRKKDHGLQNSFVVLNSILYKVSKTIEGTLGTACRSVVKKISDQDGKEYALKITKSTTQDFDDNEIPALKLLNRHFGNFCRKKEDKTTEQPCNEYEFQFAYKKYTAMPIISGTTLNQLFKDNPNINKYTRTKIAIGFIEDLIYLHERGILPIDLLGQNIMLNDLSADVLEVKIIDFESAIILPPGQEQILCDNYFDPSMPIEEMRKSLPPESINTEQFPEKIICSRRSNIWDAAQIIARLGFPEIAEQMQSDDAAKKPTLVAVKEQLIALLQPTATSSNVIDEQRNHKKQKIR